MFATYFGTVNIPLLKSESGCRREERWDPDKSKTARKVLNLGTPCLVPGARCAMVFTQDWTQTKNPCYSLDAELLEMPPR